MKSWVLVKIVKVCVRVLLLLVFVWCGLCIFLTHLSNGAQGEWGPRVRQLEQWWSEHAEKQFQRTLDAAQADVEGGANKRSVEMMTCIPNAKRSVQRQAEGQSMRSKKNASYQRDV